MVFYAGSRWLPGDAAINEAHSSMNSPYSSYGYNPVDGHPVLTEYACICSALISAVRPCSGFDGNIGEVIVFESALSTADMQAVEQYLMQKWALQRGDYPSPYVMSVNYYRRTADDQFVMDLVNPVRRALL